MASEHVYGLMVIHGRDTRQSGKGPKQPIALHRRYVRYGLLFLGFRHLCERVKPYWRLSPKARLCQIFLAGSDLESNQRSATNRSLVSRGRYPVKCRRLSWGPKATVPRYVRMGGRCHTRNMVFQSPWLKSISHLDSIQLKTRLATLRRVFCFKLRASTPSIDERAVGLWAGTAMTIGGGL